MGGRFYIAGDRLDHFTTHILDTSNEINGKPIGYIRNQTGGAILGTYSQLVIVNCSKLKVNQSNLVQGCSGILVAYSQMIEISNLTIDKPWIGPIQLSQKANNCTIIDNNFTGVNIRFWQSMENLVKGNRFKDGYLQVTDSEHNKIIANYIESEGMDGIDSYRSEYIEYRDNVIHTKGEVSAFKPALNIDLRMSVWTTLTNNTLYGPGISNDDGWSSLVMDENNTVNGKPIILIRDKVGSEVTSDFGQLFCIGCKDLTITGTVLKGAPVKILLGECENVSIHHNLLTGSYAHSIKAYSSQRLNISKNMFDGNHTGMYLSGCRDSVIYNNYLLNHSRNGIYLVSCTNLTISRNYVSNSTNSPGIYFNSCSACTITYNHFENCTEYALRLAGGSGNLAHHNMFVNNNLSDTGGVLSPQVKDSSGIVTWDNGTEGNYWSEYTTRYPTATNDGTTWDTPYDILVSKGYQDAHPLVDFEDVVPPIALTDAKDGMVEMGGTVVFNVLWAIDDVGITNTSWTIDHPTIKTTHTGNTFNYTFDLPGNYTIVFRVEDAAGNWDGLEVLVTVPDEENPVAKAGADIEVDQGTRVQLDGRGSIDNGGIAHYQWSFEYNGSTVSLEGAMENFTFDLAGKYNITLTVTDYMGNQAIDFTIVTVRDIESPFADAGEDQTIDQHEEVEFDGMASVDNIGVAHWIWTFIYQEEEQRLEGPTPSFTFEYVGEYTIVLNVSDAAGNLALDELTVTVKDTTPPVAVAGEDLTVVTGTVVNFDGSGSTDNVALSGWTWTFVHEGEEVVLSGPDPEYLFTELGSIEVHLNVTDHIGLWATDTLVVTVIYQDVAPPKAIAGGNIVTDPFGDVELDGSGSTDNVGIVNWTWEIDLGGDVTHLYGERVEIALTVPPGEYVATLTVFDAAGNLDSTSITISIIDSFKPQALAGEDKAIRAGETMTFDGIGSTDNVGVVNWTWSFNYNGSTITLHGGSPSFQFDEEGNYTVTLRVADLAGNWDEDTVLVKVTSATGPDDINGNGNGEEDGTSVYLFIALAIAVVVVLSAVALLLRRKVND